MFPVRGSPRCRRHPASSANSGTRTSAHLSFVREKEPFFPPFELLRENQWPSTSNRGWASFINNPGTFCFQCYRLGFPGTQGSGERCRPWWVSVSAAGTRLLQTAFRPLNNHFFQGPQPRALPGTAQKLHLRGGPLKVPRRRQVLWLHG